MNNVAQTNDESVKAENDAANTNSNETKAKDESGNIEDYLSPKGKKISSTKRANEKGIRIT
ncbi:hypothetical protein [Acinetobacter baumannii]|uniref:hypothetical protein n=1 Tax=Acinetobacter baumannii TaxID=470 RepID=UPI001D1881C8|nr:hypothetical protein [Acinetobacter baumannii]